MVQQINPKNNYDLTNFSAPKVSGALLVIVTWLAEWIPPLARLLGNDSGIFHLRNRYSSESPTYFPIDYETLQEENSNAKAKLTLDEAFKILQEKESKRLVNTSLDYHRRYINGETNPIEVVTKLLNSIETNNMEKTPLNVLIKFSKEDIIKQAQQSFQRYKLQTPIGPLDGVPIAVKDEMDVLGYKTSVGTKFLSLEPLEDASIVSRLRNQGAIIIGKTNMHEFGLDVTNCNPNSGTPRNPHNLNHFTGGSSGGSAAIVAAGICPIAIGADGGGSIRIPAAYNGLYGLKCTHGRISGLGSYPLAPTVGVVGPICSSAYDLALAYMISAGPNPKDQNSIIQPSPTISSFQLTDDLSDLKIGVYWPYFNDADPSIVKCCTQLIDKLASLSAQIIEIEIPGLQDMRKAHATAICAEFTEATKTLPRSEMSYPTRTALAIFDNINSKDYVSANKVRTEGMKLFANIFKNVDVVVTPTTGITAPEIPPGALEYGLSDYSTSSAAMKYIFTSNLLGLPAVSCPVGYDENSLPIGIQFQARWYNEDVLLRLANVCETLTGNETKKPQVYLPNI